MDEGLGEIQAIDHFHNFIIDLLCRCSEIDADYARSVMDHLQRTIGVHPLEIIQDGRVGMDGIPEQNWNIPLFQEKLIIARDACERYISHKPENLRTSVHDPNSLIVNKFKNEYLDKMLQTIDAVYPNMRNATEVKNDALVNIAKLHPKIFWTCFWETATGLTTIMHYASDEDNNCKLLDFIRLPMKNELLSFQDQWQQCRWALQSIIDRRESHSPAKRILNILGDSFAMALEITGLTLFPHESCLSEATSQSMKGILTRRRAAQGRGDTIFMRKVFNPPF